MDRGERLVVRVAGVVVAVAATLFIRAQCMPSDEPHFTGLDAVGTGGGSGVVPAALGGEGALKLLASAAPDPRGERLRLTHDDAEIELLLLRDPAASGPARPAALRFEHAILSAPRPAAGAAFVAAVAGWLGTAAPLPPARAGVLDAVPITVAYLGAERRPDGRLWEARKLFFEEAGRSAEVYLNVSEDRRDAELLEKDEEYRGDLVALLAMALRDGHAPRRTAADDPALESDAPLVAALTALAAPAAGLIGGPVGSGYLAAADEPGRVLHWRDPAEPPRELCRLAGRAHTLTVAANERFAALILIHPADAAFLSSSDPGEVLIVDVAAGTCGAPGPDGGAAGAERISTFSNVVFAPDGKTLAVSALHGAAPPLQKTTLVLDAATGRVLARTDPSLELAPDAWSADGLALARYRFEGDAMFVARYLWRPAAEDAPRAIPAPGPPRPETTFTFTSPDGRYAIRAAADGSALEVTGGKGSGGAGARRLVRSRADDVGALKLIAAGTPPEWLGPHSLVLATDDLLVVDLATLRVRYLLPRTPGATYRHASADGRRVWVTRADGTLTWGDTGAGR